jgi:hypothetical protein
MKKVGHKLEDAEQKRGVGRPKTGSTKKKISVSVDQKVLHTSLVKWQNEATTSGLVETLLRAYVSGGLATQRLQ